MGWTRILSRERSTRRCKVRYRKTSLSKNDDGDEDAEDENHDREQIDMVREPGFRRGRGVGEEGGDEFVFMLRGDLRGVGGWVGRCVWLRLAGRDGLGFNRT